MDAQLKAKWVEALRSGEFKQAEGALHDQKHDSYCCLGVLCKVMGAEFGPATKDFYIDYDHVPHIGDRILSDGEGEELDSSLVAELGIPQKDLIQMNDGYDRVDPETLETEVITRKHSFAEIADYIEKNL